MAGREAFTRGVVQTDMLGWYLRAGGVGWRALGEPLAQSATVLLPWTLALPWVVWGAFRSRLEESECRGRRLLILWAGVTFLAVALSREQRMRYYLPLCPPLAALLAGWYGRRAPGRRRAAFAGAWLVAACGLVGWQASTGPRHARETDLRGLSRELGRAPRLLYAVDLPELALAFYLDAPVEVLPSGRPVAQYLADARGGYLIVATRALTATDGAAGPLADGLVGGRRFAVFAAE
jgi:hypothetical protein